jgi:hypothetical protein
VWALSPAEIAAVFDGVVSRETVRTRSHVEVSLLSAWHMAAWTTAAQVGKLKDWAEYRRHLTGRPAPSESAVPAQSWQDRKRERQAQMEQLKRHQAMRARVPHKPPVRRHG